MSTDEIRKLINEALSFGYHVAKDEAKGIPSHGYGTRFFDTYLIEQKLLQHGVMQAEGSDGVSGAAVGQRSVGTSGRVGCVHNTLKYIGPWYSCETCGTHFNARAEAPPEGACAF